MISKYGFDISNDFIEHNINRLTNQIWKLIPMRENGEDWKNQIKKVIVELVGFYEIFKFNDKFLTLLSNLEGLCLVELDFIEYRSKIFETISLLRECYKNATES